MDALSKSNPYKAVSNNNNIAQTASSNTTQSQITGFDSNISSSYIYETFMTGDNSIPEYQNYLQNISRFGVLINKTESLGNNILQSVAAYTNEMINLYGMTTTLNFSTLTVDISYTKADGTTVNETVPINEAILLYNTGLKAMEWAYSTKVYPKISEENPSMTFPTQMNLPNPLPFFDPPGAPITSIPNPFTNDPNDQLTLNPTTTPAMMNVSEAQAYMQQLQGNTSQLETVSTNFMTFMVNEYRKLKTAWQALSNTLESLQTKLDQILSQNIS